MRGWRDVTPVPPKPGLGAERTAGAGDPEVGAHQEAAGRTVAEAVAGAVVFAEEAGETPPSRDPLGKACGYGGFTWCGR